MHPLKLYGNTNLKEAPKTKRSQVVIGNIHLITKGDAVIEREKKTWDFTAHRRKLGKCCFA